MLLIGMPDSRELLELAARLTQGLVVVVASDEEVREGRRAARDCDNVMFTVREETGVIPWQDGFFTVIHAPGELDSEMRRVLAPKSHRADQ